MKPLGLSPETRLAYQFGHFRLDAEAKILLKAGEPVHLGRKPVEILLVLAAAQGQVVTKEELLRSVWPDRVVDDANLTQNIALARKALSAERGEPGYIETFSGRGYRMVGPVEMSGVEQAPLAAPGTRRRAFLFFGLAVVLSAVGVYWPRPTAAVDAIRVLPVTRFTGKEFQPSISPAGDLAFLWEQDGSQPAHLWILPAGELAPRRITSDTAVYSGAAWSPDSRRIAFLRFSESKGAIVIADAAGGSQRTLADVHPTRHGLPYRHLDWSPDGKWLAVDDVAPPGQTLAIFLVSVENGERRRLTEPEEFSIGDVAPRFSPDGRTLSFIRVLHRANQELFAVAVSGAAPRRITADAWQISDQGWLTDQALVISSNRGGEFRLWKTQPHHAEPWRHIQATGVYGDFPIQFSLRPATGELYYAALQHDLNIWRLSLAGNKLESHPWTRVVASTGQDVSPQYSPDGSRICFRSDRTGQEQLWVTSSDGAQQQQVTKGEVRPSVGRWSPDGRSIVFNDSQTGDIYNAAEQEGGRWVVSPAGAKGYHPVYSADGRFLYAGTMTSIVKVPVAGGPPQEVLNMRGISLGLSADGRALYFVRDATDSSLWRLDLESGQAAKFLDGLVPYCSSCWDVTSSGIYYLGVKTDAGKQHAVFFYDFAAKSQRLVADYPEPLLPIGSGPFSLSRDARFLLTVRVDPSNTDIMRVERFR